MALYSLIAAALGALLVARLFHNRLRTNLRNIPGPFLAGFSDLWRFFDCLVSQPHDTHISLHRKYGALVRIGPRTVSVSDISLIPVIYGLHSGFTKTKFYTLHMLPYKKEFTPSLFTTLDESYHTKYKRPIANAYSMSTLVEFEPLIDSTTSLFMKRLDEFSASGERINLGLWLQMYAFDVIGEIVFSKKLGFLETRTDIDGIIADIRRKVFLGGAVGQIPAIDAYLIKNPLYLHMADTHPVVKFTVRNMEERSEKTQDRGGPRDFLARCYEAQAKYPDLVTDRTIRMYNIDNVLAGSDTTSISLRAILYYLMKNPSAMERCLVEIDALPESAEYVTWKQATSMPYLQACMKEALRMHPAVGLLLERHVPPGGIELNGQFMPEGTIVGVNPWVAARDRSVYGADADSFRPERWLEASEDELRLMERANLTFGSGARSCIGKNISMLEMAKLVPQLLRHYTFSFPSKDHQWKVVGGWFVGQDDFLVTVSKRIVGAN